MEDTKPIDRNTFLELENLSLKIRLLQNSFQAIGVKALTSAGLTQEDWGIDLDRGLFVQKPK